MILARTDVSGTIDIPLLKGEAREDAIRRAQVRGIFDFGIYPFLMNGIISISVSLIYYFAERGTHRQVLVWTLLNISMLIGRYVLQRWLQREESRHSPEKILRQLVFGSFLGGMLWASLPMQIPDVQLGGRHAYVTLIMVGVAAGGLVRGVPYARIAIAFSLPPVISVGGFLIADGSMMCYVLSANMSLYGVMLFNACRLGARNFVENVLMKQEATLLAQSLQAANRDISESNQALKVLAGTDPLTGLANRARFNTELRETLAAATCDASLSMLIFDLDRFKVVNDTLGHAAGDQLLTAVARRLTEALPPHAFAARLGGDEFAVLCPQTEGPDEALSLAERCLEAICKPVMLAGRQYGVEASIGAALAPRHAVGPDDLFACADRALYRAKGAGRRCAMIFSHDMREREERQARIELDVQDALATGAVEAWFQPQVRLSDGNLIGVEALVRWNHPVLGTLQAHEIVEAVRARRLHGLLASRMTEQACLLLRHLQTCGHADVRVAVNLSADDFAHYDVAATLGAIVENHGVDPGLFEIELTEEALLDVNKHGADLTALERKGFRLALDDFGMGSTSLSYLRSIRIDRLKIDRDFVSGIAASRHNQALVTAMVALGRMLDIDILVEGVETEEDRVILRALGCETAQGWLYAQAMSTEKVLDWITLRTRAA